MSRAKPLTMRMLRGLSHATAYATAGGPEDIGLSDDAKGEDEFAETLDAHRWVQNEIARREARAKARKDRP